MSTIKNIGILLVMCSLAHIIPLCASDGDGESERRNMFSVLAHALGSRLSRKTRSVVPLLETGSGRPSQEQSLVSEGSTEPLAQNITAARNIGSVEHGLKGEAYADDEMPVTGPQSSSLTSAPGDVPRYLSEKEVADLLAKMTLSQLVELVAQANVLQRSSFTLPTSLRDEYIALVAEILATRPASILLSEDELRQLGKRPDWRTVTSLVDLVLQRRPSKENRLLSKAYRNFIFKFARKTDTWVNSGTEGADKRKVLVGQFVKSLSESAALCVANVASCLPTVTD